MQIFANVKSLRRERGFLESKSYELPHDVRTLRDLIIALVDAELSAYNRREPGEMLKALLSQDEIDRMAEVGKVGFGRIHAQVKADRIKAEENALQCFEDGIIRVVAGDDELTSLDEPVPAQDGVTYTFIRLTFLAGSMW